MSKITLAELSSLVGLLLASLCPVVVAGPVTNVYEITSGQYITCCGIAGEFHQALPAETQTRFRLITDAETERAKLFILGGRDNALVFQILENGVIHSGYIEFGQPILRPSPVIPGETQQHYIVSNSASGLKFDGATIRPMQGADMINFFAHSNVTARLQAVMPVEATIRVASVEICWPSVAHQNYQVQYRTSISSNEWVNLHDPVEGDGGTRCVEDGIGPAEPRRFYRVVLLP